MKPGISVVGSVNMDLVFRTPRMPAPGETLSGHEFHEIPGGKGANQAVAAARMGGAVSLIACVGADGFGRRSQQTLQQDGIDITHVRVADDCASGVAGILVCDDGENSIVLAAGANARLSPADVTAAQDVIGAGKLLLCQLEVPMETVQAALACAKRQGVRVVLNPAPVQALPEGMLAQVDYLVVNETEAGQLSGVAVQDVDSAAQAAQALLGRGVGAVLLTLGEHGVLAADAAGQQHFPGLKVQVVDTTAAGDTFVGALAVGLGQGLDLRAAAAAAQYAAALTVTRLGAQSSIPQLAEVEAFRAHAG
ncbi:ribokinase [Massilia sp. W12]|uniref:ribokinase n=1 Tax=Massilia sp. W12 TaxID=3126507 RepID=UPI0030CC9721